MDAGLVQLFRPYLTSVAPGSNRFCISSPAHRELIQVSKLLEVSKQRRFCCLSFLGDCCSRVLVETRVVNVAPAYMRKSWMPVQLLVTDDGQLRRLWATDPSYGGNLAYWNVYSLILKFGNTCGKATAVKWAEPGCANLQGSLKVREAFLHSSFPISKYRCTKDHTMSMWRM